MMLQSALAFEQIIKVKEFPIFVFLISVVSVHILCCFFTFIALLLKKIFLDKQVRLISNYCHIFCFDLCRTKTKRGI